MKQKIYFIWDKVIAYWTNFIFYEKSNYCIIHKLFSSPQKQKILFYLNNNNKRLTTALNREFNSFDSSQKRLKFEIVKKKNWFILY